MAPSVSLLLIFSSNFCNDLKIGFKDEYCSSELCCYQGMVLERRSEPW